MSNIHVVKKKDRIRKIMFQGNLYINQFMILLHKKSLAPTEFSETVRYSSHSHALW